MANQITDNRTLLFNGGDGTGGAPDDLSGASTGITDNSTFLEGTTSYTYSASNSRSGMLFDAGSAQNYANNVFSLTVNSGVVGLLDTKANGGFTIRFCGATVTDWFEVYVGGSDDWPTTIQGGWANFVVDIETARSTAVTNGWTNGTVPATSAIRYVGFSQILTAMPKMADNTWFDSVHRLPDGTAGILIEGRNGGTTDWNSADILTQLGSGQMAFYRGPGGSYVLSTPIQFGIADATTHGFSDTSAVWLWDNQEFLPDDVYALTFVGAVSGTTNVTMGVKSGTGDAATGSQGITITSAADGPRWSLDATAANLDNIDFYGCSFTHGADFLINNSVCEFIGNVFIDCNSAQVDNSTFIRNSIIDANTADGVAFLFTDDLSDVVFCNFSFSDGHAIEIESNTVDPQTSKGNKFSGYGADASNDAAVFNDSGGNLTINITDAGDTPTTRTTTGTTTVNNAVTITLTNLVAGSRVYIENTTDSVVLFNQIEATTTFSESVNYTGDKTLLVRVRNASGTPKYVAFETGGTLTSNGFSAQVNQVQD